MIITPQHPASDLIERQRAGVAALPRRRALLLGALALPLAGCVAMPYGTYYRPSTPDAGARLRRAWCGGQAGPATMLELDAPAGVRLTVRAERDYGERQRPDLPLRLEITLPPQQSVRFLGPTLELREAGSGRPIAAAQSVRVLSRVTLAAADRVDAIALRPAGTAATARDGEAPHGRASWSFEAAADFAPTSFALQLPAVLIDGQSHATPAIVLSRPGSAARPGDYRSSAEQQHLRQREAACRRDTPRLACGNIVNYGERSFEVATLPLLWRGSWSRFETPVRAETLRGTQTLAVRDARPWRLAETAVVLTDTTSGRRESLRFAQFHLDFDDSIALDTPLRAVPAATPTQLLIEASLPDGLPGFELRLPPLQVGAQRLQIGTIGFDRRSFDGGIEPFNC